MIETFAAQTFYGHAKKPSNEQYFHGATTSLLLFGIDPIASSTYRSNPRNGLREASPASPHEIEGENTGLPPHSRVRISPKNP